MKHVAYVELSLQFCGWCRWMEWGVTEWQVSCDIKAFSWSTTIKPVFTPNETSKNIWNKFDIFSHWITTYIVLAEQLRIWRGSCRQYNAETRGTFICKESDYLPSARQSPGWTSRTSSTCGTTFHKALKHFRLRLSMSGASWSCTLWRETCSSFADRGAVTRS